jgi:hypothetical protein
MEIKLLGIIDVGLEKIIIYKTIFCLLFCMGGVVWFLEIWEDNSLWFAEKHIWTEEERSGKWLEKTASQWVHFAKYN